MVGHVKVNRIDANVHGALHVRCVPVTRVKQPTLKWFVGHYLCVRQFRGMSHDSVSTKAKIKKRNKIRDVVT